MVAAYQRRHPRFRNEIPEQKQQARSGRRKAVAAGQPACPGHADATIDYTTTDFTRTGHTYDALVDLVGNRRLHDLRRCVRPGGSLVLSGGGTPGNGRLVGPLRLLIGAMAVARLQPFEVTVPQAVPDSRTLAHVADLVGSGSLQPLIDRTFPLEDAAAAIRYVETEHPRGKVVLTIA